jgi:hypothetical protein
VQFGRSLGSSHILRRICYYYILLCKLFRRDWRLAGIMPVEISYSLFLYDNAIDTVTHLLTMWTSDDRQ